MRLSISLQAVLSVALMSSPLIAADPTPVNQVFQFMEAGTCTAWSDGQPSKATSYLWIPEKCQKVRGLLILCNNVPEHRLVGHEAIRAVCAANDLAIVWNTPSFMNFKKTEPGKKKMSEEWDTAAGFLQQQLDALAKTSGYAEIATVPWLPMGESGHLLMVDALVESRPERCIAGIWIKNSHLPPKNRQVPALVVYGSAQEWGQDKSDIRSKWNDIGKTYEGILAQRKANPTWNLSYVIDGHSGHFDVSERLASYFAHYIDVMVKARLPADGGTALTTLKLERGFVADLPVPGHEGKAPEPAKAAVALPWFPDLQSAKEAQDFADINWKAETQLPIFLDAQGKPLPHDFNGICNLKSFDFEDDGLTFTVKGALASTIPADFQNAGEPLAQGPKAPVAEWQSGPLEPLGNQRFRVALDRTWLSGAAIYVGLRQPGTETIRGIFQPAGVDLRGLRQLPGKAQKITFSAPADIAVGSAPVALKATSDSGLPVSFFVVAGPAIIRDGKLELTTIPPRAKMPIEITIGAWQWGRRSEPAVKIAEVVQQKLRVTAADH